MKEPSYEIILWMTYDIRAGLQYKRETNQSFKKGYERNKKSKVEALR